MKIYLNKFYVFLIIIITNFCTLKNPEHNTGDDISAPKKIGESENENIEPEIITSSTPNDPFVSFKVGGLYQGTQQSHLRMNKKIYDLNKDNPSIKTYFLQCGSAKGKYTSTPPPTLVIVYKNERKGTIKVGIVKRNDLQVLLKNKPKLENILKKKYGLEDEALRSLKSPQFKKKPTQESPAPPPTPAPAPTPDDEYEAFIKELPSHVYKWHKVPEKGIKDWKVIPINNDKIFILMNYHRFKRARMYLMEAPKSPKKSEMAII